MTFDLAGKERAFQAEGAGQLVGSVRGLAGCLKRTRVPSLGPACSSGGLLGAGEEEPGGVTV